VHPSLPVKSVKELIALAKARPGELNYASGTAGSTTHLATELFKSMAGVNIVRVAYKGNAPAVTGAVSGEGQVIIMDAGLILPHHKSGRLRALAATSLTPSTLAPGLPTVAESGVPGFESIGVTGLIAPAKTPAAIITRINQEVTRYINRPEVKERFLPAGAEVLGSTPEQFVEMMRSDIAKWSKIIKDIGINAE
jgi:tripartite-type tricarboxylate transporter receptor subunit TctC